MSLVKVKNEKTVFDARRFLNRAASGTLLCRMFYLGSGYIITLMLTLWLGVRGLGVYNYVISWVMLGALIGKCGLEDYITREATHFRSDGKNRSVKAVWQAAKIGVLLNSFALVLLSGIVLMLLQISDEDLKRSFYYGLGIIPLVSLLGVYRGWLRAAKSTLHSQIPEYVLRPLVFGTMIGIVLVFEVTPSPQLAIALSLIVTIGIVFFCWFTDPTRREFANITFETQSVIPLLRDAFPFLLIASVYLVNQKADRIMLGGMATMESVGLYTVAAQMAMLVALPQQALASSISPIVIEQYKAKGISGIESLVIRYGLFCAGGAALICSLMVFSGPWLLRLFGAEFEESYTALVILSFGYLANVSSGPVGVVLSMLHKERLVAIGVTISALVNVLANYVLIPPFGVNGAAAATAISMIVWNVLLTVFAKRSLGVNVNLMAKLIPKPILAS